MEPSFSRTAAARALVAVALSVFAAASLLAADSQAIAQATPTPTPAAPKPEPAIVFDVRPPTIVVTWEAVVPGASYGLERSFAPEGGTASGFATIATVVDDRTGPVVVYIDRVPAFGRYCYRTRVLDAASQQPGDASEAACAVIREGDVETPQPPPTQTPTTPTAAITPGPPTTGTGTSASANEGPGAPWFVAFATALLLGGTLLAAARRGG